MMSNMNSLILEGKIASKPEKKLAMAANFTLATSRFCKDSNGERQEEICYFEVEAWGSLADIVSRHDVGDELRLVGRLKQKRWTNDDGRKCSSVLVIAEHIEFKPETVENESINF